VPDPDPIDERDQPRGSKGVAIANALASLGLGVILPVLIVVGLYTYLTIYAIVKAIGSAPDEANPTVVLVGLMALVALFVVGFAVTVVLIGRTADPKRRR
jgi:amino acid permease